jgi:hypothetical protein
MEPIEKFYREQDLAREEYLNRKREEKKLKSHGIVFKEGIKRALHYENTI